MAAKFDVDCFVKEQLRLLQLERSAEIEESVVSKKTGNIRDLEKRGICVTKLSLGGQCTGLYGKHLVTLLQNKSKENKSSKARYGEDGAPASREIVATNCFSNGDIVGLQLSNADLKEDDIASGVVTKANDNAVTVAFDDAVEITQGDLYRLIKLSNDVTYRRLKEALQKLNSSKQHGHLKDVLFHMTTVGPPVTLVKDESFVPFDKSLNDSQLDAVRFALNQKEIAVIHGPPGTGKTTTVIEIIKQAVRTFDLKVLACAPSNVAVDNLVAKLAGEKIKIVRLGHPARVYPHLQKYSLDAALMNSDSAEIVQGVRNDITDTLMKLKRAKNDGEARKVKGELKYLKSELRERENKALKYVLSNANVILSTTTSSSVEGPMKHLEKDHFDLLIIDEAAQALEASCWIALPFANKCIFAGDHQQLPPTIISKEAAKKGLEITLMERVIKQFGEPVVRMLTTQYRMHSDIMTWPSQQLYDGRLIAGENVCSHLLSQLPGVESDENTSIPLLFIDTAGCFMYELVHETEESKGNTYEVSIVEYHIDALVASGVKQEDIGIITPYNLQVELLRQSLSLKYPKIEIRSVDGFQGREKEAIVISLVRSNDQGEVGFLKEDRRLNVAITRARRHLTVVGDSETISHHSFLKSFFEYVTEHGDVRSAESYSQRTTTKTSKTQSKNVMDDSVSLLKDFELLSYGQNKKRIEDRSLSEGKKKNQIESKLSDYSAGENDRKHDASRIMDNDSNLDLIRRHDSKASKITKDELEKRVFDFCNSFDQNELTFDSSLDAKGRFYVHELAERFGLLHKSLGEGKDRRISIRKASWKQLREDCQQEQESEAASAHTETSICQLCSTEIPKSNLELHVLRCKKDIDCEKKQYLEMTQGKKKIEKSNKKKDRQKQTVQNDKESEDDFDKLIEEFTKVDSVCKQDKCKVSVLTLGQRCKFCGKTFCLKHGLAEVHGCGEAARTDARAKARQYHENHTSKQSNEIKKKHIKRKLEKKITEMENERTRAKDKQKDS